jgi:hypothetical protein
MILRNTLGNKFGYCEFYEDDCCKSVPCQSPDKRDTAECTFFFQKSHDFNLSDPIMIPGIFRVVQYRSPVPRSLSNYELYLKNGVEDNIRTFRRFLVDEALYFCKFYNKWIEKPSSSLFVLTYEQLTADPLRALLHFFQFVNCPINLDHLSAGIAQSIGRRGRDNAPLLPSQVFAHRYAGYPVLGNFEQLVLSNCPGYFPLRHFPAGDADNSLIGKVFHAMKSLREGDYHTAIPLANAAYAQDPQDQLLARLCETLSGRQ